MVCIWAVRTPQFCSEAQQTVTGRGAAQKGEVSGLRFLCGADLSLPLLKMEGDNRKNGPGGFCGLKGGEVQRQARGRGKPGSMQP